MSRQSIIAVISKTSWRSSSIRPGNGHTGPQAVSTESPEDKTQLLPEFKHFSTGSWWATIPVFPPKLLTDFLKCDTFVKYDIFQSHDEV
jgi:hypothetical protein